MKKLRVSLVFLICAIFLVGCFDNSKDEDKVSDTLKAEALEWNNTEYKKDHKTYISLSDDTNKTRAQEKSMAMELRELSKNRKARFESLELKTETAADRKLVSELKKAEKSMNKMIEARAQYYEKKNQDRALKVDVAEQAFTDDYSTYQYLLDEK